MKLPDWADRVSWLTWPIVLVVIQQILFPAPAGALLAGLILGLITSLVSLGMYLVYRANRVLNFTAGELGLLPAVLSVMLIVESGLSWYLGFGMASSGRGARCRGRVPHHPPVLRRTRLVVTVATIGVAQLIAVAPCSCPAGGAHACSRSESTHRSTSTSRSGHACSTQTTSSRSSIAPLAMLAVGVLLRSTRIGIAIRAAAEMPSRAAMLGIPVKGLQSVVWSVATMLGVHRIVPPSRHLRPARRRALGLLLLLRSLAALTLGRLVHLPTIIAASILPSASSRRRSSGTPARSRPKQRWARSRAW